MDGVPARERIYDIFADPHEDVGGKIERALAVGTEFLDLPIGFLTRIEDGTQRIVHATGDHPLIQPGESCPLESAYCRRTVEVESALAVQDAAASPAISAAALRTFDLGTYVGCKVVVNDAVHGTVCFAATGEREAGFTDAESHFVELLARLLGRTFERRAYERELAAREAKLADRRENFRALVDASFDLVFRIDASGRFTYVSPSVERLVGRPAAAFVGRPFTAMLPDEETIDQAGDLYEQVMSGRTVEELYFLLDHATDSRVWVDVRVTPVYASDVAPADRTPADITGVQGAARDATGRRRRERMIQVLNRVLRHNLRNDMTVVSGFAGVLRDRLTGEEADFAARILETADRLAALGETATRLEATIEEPPAVEATDVVPVVERVATRIDETYPAASVALSVPGTAVAESAPRLETAVDELATNAAKHAGDRPSIGLSIRVRDSTVTIRVDDDGPGLPDQERAVIEAGEETSLVHGSGLGLWLVHWIVESLDGQLRVHETGATTGIEIRLPRAGSGDRPDGSSGVA
jgi:PAS domain S-box-containing protein